MTRARQLLYQMRNLAITNPKLMTAILVLIHARNVRSLAKNSVARLSTGMSFGSFSIRVR